MPRPALLLKSIGYLLLCASLMAPASTAVTLEGRGDRALLLDSGWVGRKAAEVPMNGAALSMPLRSLEGWLPAVVPGTVLTTMLANGQVPDPFYGMNNELIPDIHQTGNEAYTWWFVTDLNGGPLPSDGQLWLDLRGVNYGCDLYLNGQRLNAARHLGMFLRQSYNITALLHPQGPNRLAVLVYPPDPPGNPNGGQGGDGTIGRNVSSQFTAGWDWIRPIRDRNTGIWDQVALVRTGPVRLRDPHIITLVPGRRRPDGPQAPAIVRASVTVDNPGRQSRRGTVQLTIAGLSCQSVFSLKPGEQAVLTLPDLRIENPRLWWPHGSGPQELYETSLSCRSSGGALSDQVHLQVGLREISTAWNQRTRSREVMVNGQSLFIKGGNWIASDAMLRFSPERYDAEIRFHRDMNLNLIRIWGGGLTERPEFFEACDRYGLLVFQDFWMSGDCNGKWRDPMKKEDQWTRRRYPDDHRLFINSVADQIRLLRNHPSLAFYCGGNEIPPPADILAAIEDTLLPRLDPSRYFFTYSNADSMSYNSIGGNGDGGYGIQPIEKFWEHQSFPFNSEIGSVGVGDYESLERFIPPDHLVIPDPDPRRLDPVWRYHAYHGYGRHVEPYGEPADLRQWAEIIQLLNFDQYRGLMEGHLAHMWDWYTGVIIWKTQNPWSAMRGQMYDWWLDPNAGLYGLRSAGEPAHVMCSPKERMLYVVNHRSEPLHDLMVQARALTISGEDSLIFQWIVEIGAHTVQKIESIKPMLQRLSAREGNFLDLRLVDAAGGILSDNFYWLPDSTGRYSGLGRLAPAAAAVSARLVEPGRIAVTIANPAPGPVAFFNRLALIDSHTGKRILPVFYSDNYISVLPGEERRVEIDFPTARPTPGMQVSMRGWNSPERRIPIQL